MPRNWSADEAKIKEKGARVYAIWKLEQMVNFGLVGGEKIKMGELKKYLPLLSLDKDRRKTMEFLMGN